MLLTNSELERILFATRSTPTSRRTLEIAAALILILTYGLAYATATGHWFVISLATVILLAWTRGFLVGLVAAIAVPAFAIPVQLAYGIPLKIVLQDTTGFLIFTLIGGTTVGLLSRVFGEIFDMRQKVQMTCSEVQFCRSCHRVRKETQEWVPLQEFLEEHSDLLVTRGICPKCFP